MCTKIINCKWKIIRGHLQLIVIVLMALSLLGACSSQVTPQDSTVSAPSSDVGQPTSAPPSASELNCTSPASPTPALAEGPYFKANSPERSSLLEANTPGTRLTLTGSVLTTDCQPVVNALLDFWQADASGQYDNTGYHLRGHQYTDENGRYELITVVPGEYPGRTEHIHFKVQAPNGPVLTSQLFFPDLQDNQADQIFDPSLVIDITEDRGSSLEATFNFIIKP